MAPPQLTKENSLKANGLRSDLLPLGRGEVVLQLCRKGGCDQDTIRVRLHGADGVTFDDELASNSITESENATPYLHIKARFANQKSNSAHDAVVECQQPQTLSNLDFVTQPFPLMAVNGNSS